MAAAFYLSVVSEEEQHKQCEPACLWLSQQLRLQLPFPGQNPQGRTTAAKGNSSYQKL